MLSRVRKQMPSANWPETNAKLEAVVSTMQVAGQASKRKSICRSLIWMRARRPSIYLSIYPFFLKMLLVTNIRN
jgi:hypothetical protein